MKHLRRWLLAIILIIVLLAGGYYWTQQSKSSSSEPTRVVKKQVQLVALGDSLTYGQGDDADKGGYVGRIQHKLAHHYHTKVSAVNYGVSGDRSDQILDRLNKQSKIRQSLKKADVIVMTVGGNDLMQSFQKDLLTSYSQGVEKKVNAQGKIYQAKLQKLFRAVRQQNPHAPLCVFSIYNPVYVYFPQANAIDDSISHWNNLTQQTLKDYGPAYFVNIDSLMSHGQYRTKAEQSQLLASSKSVNSQQVSQKQLIKIMDQKGHNKNYYISTEDNFHPNRHGYQAMTKKLFLQMKKHDGFMYQQR